MTLPPKGKSDAQRLLILLSKVNVLNMTGDYKSAYSLLGETRSWLEKSDPLAEIGLYTTIFMQGTTAMRRGETENCIMSRVESSCILPIAPARRSHQSHRLEAGDSPLYRVPRALP